MQRDTARVSKLRSYLKMSNCRVANLATFDNPFVYPAGINYVIVNGEVAVDDGRPQYTKSGKVLRFER